MFYFLLLFAILSVFIFLLSFSLSYFISFSSFTFNYLFTFLIFSGNFYTFSHNFSATPFLDHQIYVTLIFWFILTLIFSFIQFIWHLFSDLFNFSILKGGSIMALRVQLHFGGPRTWVGIKTSIASFKSMLNVNMAKILVRFNLFYIRF